MPELTPIKIKILLKEDGYYDYPNFRSVLPFFTTNPGYKGGKLHYDEKSHASDDTTDSPYGQRWAIKLVDPEFARQAIAAFPDRVFEMTEIEAQEFWDNNAYGHVSDTRYDVDALRGLQVELDLRTKLGQDTTALEAKIAKALDKNDAEPGIKENTTKLWSTMKAQKNITIKSAAKS